MFGHPSLKHFWQSSEGRSGDGLGLGDGGGEGGGEGGGVGGGVGGGAGGDGGGVGEGEGGEGVAPPTTWHKVMVLALQMVP